MFVLVRLGNLSVFNYWNVFFNLKCFFYIVFKSSYKFFYRLGLIRVLALVGAVRGGVGDLDILLR